MIEWKNIHLDNEAKISLGDIHAHIVYNENTKRWQLTIYSSTWLDAIDLLEAKQKSTSILEDQLYTTIKELEEGTKGNEG